MTGKLIEINLFGAPSVRAMSGAFEITGGKHKALFALLATAPFGRRTRSFLQQTLWGTACYDTGRQSLRRALADIKQIMGDSYGEVLSATNQDVTLDLSRVGFLGRPGQGAFLEGLDLHEAGYKQWLGAMRGNPDQLDGLFAPAAMPAGPSILPVVAVLPFRAIVPDPAHLLMGDWLAEEMCRSLSRSRLMAVISHLSCRQLAQQVFDSGSVRSQLNADYCVAGTVRPSGSELVLDADFIDLGSSRILWTRQFSAPASAFLQESEEGVAQVVQAVGAAIADEAIRHVAGRTLQDIEDHRLLVAGVKLMHRSTLRDFARSRELLEEAARRAPRTAEVHGWLGKWHVLSVFNRWSDDVTRDTQAVVDCTARALDLSPDNAFCLTIDGFAKSHLLRRFDLAEMRYNAALAQNPNEALGWLLKGTLLSYQDDGALSVKLVGKARRLSPIDPFGYFYDALSASAHLVNHDLEECLRYADRSIAMNDRHLSTLRMKITALVELGRGDEARPVAAELLRLDPDHTVASYESNHPNAGSRIGKRVATALRAAGVP